MNAQPTTTQDPFFQFKQSQKQGWAHFSPLEALTIPQAAKLVRHAKAVTTSWMWVVGQE